MDKSLKHSLIFGGLVGGAYALSKHAVEKRQLTKGQMKDLESLKEGFFQMQSLIETTAPSGAYVFIKQHEPEKQWVAIDTYLAGKILALESGNRVADTFRFRLDQILSSRFTAERANEKTHAVQAKFAPLTSAPERLEAVLVKRLGIFRLIQSVFVYIAAGEATDFKPDDAISLRALTAELKTLEDRLAYSLENLDWS